MLNAAKAFVAGIIAGLSAAAGNSGGTTKVDIISDVLAGVVAFNAVYFVPNKSANKATTI